MFRGARSDRLFTLLIKRLGAGLLASVVTASMLVAVGVAAVLTAPAAWAAGSPQTSQGTDFWVTFESNGTEVGDGPGSLFLFISGDTATTGTVSDPGISFSQSFTVTPGTVTTIQVPSNGEDDVTDSVQPDGIHITAGAPVAAYGLNTFPFTTDGFLGLPTSILGMSYLVEGYQGLGGSQFAVVGTAAGTTVTITPSENIDTHAAGTPFTVSLGQGQVYQLIDETGGSGDLSGTSVTSNKPVAVFAGNDCADVPPGVAACNTLAEEMTPTDTWGTSFLTEPLATRTGDTFRFMASENNTTVDVNGSAVATLNAGKFFETILASASSVTANNPIQVMQYSNGTIFDGADSDPFDITIPPYAQFLNGYTVSTEPSGADPVITNNYINVVAPTSEVGSVTVDGTDIPSSQFAVIAGSTFSGAQVPVAFGSHVLGGPLPFGVTVYGFGNADGYGYPGGFSLSPIATVTKVALSPPTGTATVGTQACLVATVTDQNNNPVAGVRVDFTVTGANPTTGFAFTGTNGQAQFCYTGAAAGADSIVAAVGAIHSATSTWTWTGGVTAAPTTLTTSLSGGGQTGPIITVPIGTSVTDAATLTGANAATAGGTVTYAVFSDPACTTSVASGGTVTVTGGVVPHATAVTLPAAGTYYWTASYSGNATNGASASACGSEKVTVTKANPTIITTPTGSPAGGNVSDTAKIAGGSSPTGTVTFQLFAPGDTSCHTALATRTGTVTGGTAASGNVAVDAAGIYNWVATYNGDTKNNPVTSPCGAEKDVVTPQTLTGQAYGLAATASLLGQTLVNLTPTPTTGAIATTSSLTSAPPCTTLSGLISAQVLCVNVTTLAFPAKSTATAAIANATVGIGGVPAITVAAVSSTSTTTCSGSAGSVTIAYLAVGSTVVISKPTAIAPNTTINVGVVKLVLNQQVVVSSPDKGLTVNAVHATVNGLGLAAVNVVLASSESDIGNCP